MTLIYFILDNFQDIGNIKNWMRLLQTKIIS